MKTSIPRENIPDFSLRINEIKVDSMRKISTYNKKEIDSTKTEDK